MNSLKRACLLGLSTLSLFASSASAQSITIEKVLFAGPASTGLENDQLSGVLYKPANFSTSTGTRAMVLMHGCSGMWSFRQKDAVNSDGSPNLANDTEKWGRKLAAEGIVALVVDSFTQREPSTLPEEDAALWQDQCSSSTYGGSVNPYTTRVQDAQAAWTYLAADSHIDSARIGLMGWSHGAQAAMVESGVKTTTTSFRTTVLFYPGCGAALGFGSPGASTWRPQHALRFNIGTADSFYSNCNSRVNTAVSVYGATVSYSAYSGAGHSFDGGSQNWSTAPASCVGLTANECAMRNADVASLSFLNTNL